MLNQLKILWEIDRNNKTAMQLIKYDSNEYCLEFWTDNGEPGFIALEPDDIVKLRRVLDWEIL